MAVEENENAAGAVQYEFAGIVFLSVVGGEVVVGAAEIEGPGRSGRVSLEMKRPRGKALPLGGRGAEIELCRAALSDPRQSHIRGASAVAAAEARRSGIDLAGTAVAANVRVVADVERLVRHVHHARRRLARHDEFVDLRVGARAEEPVRRHAVVREGRAGEVRRARARHEKRDFAHEPGVLEDEVGIRDRVRHDERILRREARGVDDAARHGDGEVRACSLARDGVLPVAVAEGRQVDAARRDGRGHGVDVRSPRAQRADGRQEDDSASDS